MYELDYSEKEFYVLLDKALRRARIHPEITARTQAILSDVLEHGDEAVLRYAAQFDKVTFSSPAAFRVAIPPLRTLKKMLTADEVKAIDTAFDHVTAYSAEQLPKSWSKKFRRGVELGEQFRPLDRVGVYIPGGTAPLVSTIIHTAAIAKCAGVREIVGVTPPRADGSVSPQMLYAFARCSVREVYAIGGVYAVGALAYGTQSIKRVQKIVGPGNAYVTEAKRLIYGDASIDMVAGPSEVMILADESANPEFLAADLLSQLEHGGGNAAILVCTTDKMRQAVKKHLTRLSTQLSRHAMLEQGLENGTFLLVAPTLKKCVEIANFVAPEHLELSVKNPKALIRFVTAAGAVFMGHYTPEPAGDFTAGPSHVLPTGSSAHYFAGLSTETFFRRFSTLSYTADALRRELPDIRQMAQMESLTAHELSATIRFQGEKK